MMSDATLSPGGPARDLLFGVLALQLDFISAADLQPALQAWHVDRSRPLPEMLYDRGSIGKTRLALLERLTEEYLSQHGDEQAALAAACAARPTPVDLSLFTSPASRGEQPTLASQPGTVLGDGFPPPPTPEPPPVRRFRIVRPHARGALGEVFLAIDEQLHREVALKEMQAPFARSRESRARFLLEAEITGQLEHPGIVPIYGLETHPDGRPYYAMRFIHGETLHDAIERFHLAEQMRREPSERQLSLRALLTQFVSVCNAIAFAHSRGILHRDLKPGNVMIGAYGETLVVDWGLAKALGRPDREDSVEVPILPTSASPMATTQGVVVGTPAFMSPEQASGKTDTLGPASDVFALGAMLYAILTGEPPFQGYEVTEILDKVKRQDFVPPRRKNRTIPPALEGIVLKAMATDPADRYPGAKDLADDVERWLADEPVSAYSEPVLTRLRRWAKRHRMMVSGAAALLLTAVVGLLIGNWLLSRAQAETARQRDAAQAHLALARKAVDDCFILATTEQIMQQERMREARRMLLERALPFYQGFRRSRPDDVELQFEEAMHLFKVGVITAEVGKYQESIEAYERARAAFAVLARRHPHDERYRVNLAQTLNNLGNLYHQHAGRRGEAHEMHEEALAIRQPLAEENPGDTDAQLNLIETVNNLNALALDEGKLDAAAKHLENVVRIARKLVDENRDLHRSLRTLGAGLHNLANVLKELEQAKPAENAYVEAIEAQRRLVALGGRLTRPRSELASTLASYTSLLDQQGRFDEAHKALDEARSLRAALAAEYQEFPEFRYELAVVEDMLGSFLLDNNRPKQALEAYQRALKDVSVLVAEYQGEARYQRLEAQVTAHLGNALRDDDRPEDALKLYAAALETLGKTTGAESGGIEASIRAGRAQALTKLKRHPEAVKEWVQARALTTGPLATHYRFQEALSRCRARDVAGLAKEAAALEKLLDSDAAVGPAGAYDLACLWSLWSGLEKGEEKERYAKRAMGLLEKARAAGLFKGEVPLKNLKKDDPDLEPIRKRPEFKALLAEVEKSSPDGP